MEAKQVTPLGNWLLCSPLRPRMVSKGGLFIAKDYDKDVRSEGVAEIVAAGPGKELNSGVVVDHGIRVGDKVLFRGFLRYAEQFGEQLGADKGTDYFFLNADDVMAVVEGPGTLGLDGEYVL